MKRTIIPQISGIDTPGEARRGFSGTHAAPQSPTAGANPSASSGNPPKALFTGDLDKLRGACPTNREKALLDLLCATGCRLDEIISPSARRRDKKPYNHNIQPESMKRSGL
jgi:hypothetical protein